MTLIFPVAAGGAIGAVLRHYAGKAALSMLGTGFTYGTLFVNVFGSFLMGLIVALFALQGNPSQGWRAFLTVGLLGGFTTFSAFSLDVVTLYERGEMTSAMIYVFTSLAFSVLALFAAMFLVRSFSS